MGEVVEGIIKLNERKQEAVSVGTSETCRKQNSDQSLNPKAALLMSTIQTALNASAGIDKNVAFLEGKKASSLDEKLLAAGVTPETLTEAYSAKGKGGTGFFELLIRKKAIDEIRLLKYSVRAFQHSLLAGTADGEHQHRFYAKRSNPLFKKTQDRSAYHRQNLR